MREEKFILLTEDGKVEVEMSNPEDIMEFATELYYRQHEYTIRKKGG